MNGFEFNYSFKVTDVCPADGASAGVAFELEYIDGSTGYPGWKWDSDGCGNGATSYSGNISRNKRIANVIVLLGIDDRGDAQLPILVDKSNVKDNPYVS